MSSVKWKYTSLEDFLSSRPLDVDGMLDDGWGAYFPVKGRVIDATILFVDISAFSARTRHLHPVETLIFVNNFFTWISAEALQASKGIIDKYIGDEMMIVFSKEFGSEDSFLDAIHTARFMAEHDHIGFGMHAGIASGEVVVGYTGTPLKYSCSVFGHPVTIARRCCGVSASDMCSSHMVFPADNWGTRVFDEVFQNSKIKKPDGENIEMEHSWRIKPQRRVELKNINALDVIEIAQECFFGVPISAEKRAEKAFKGLKKEGSYRHRRYGFEQN